MPFRAANRIGVQCSPAGEQLPDLSQIPERLRAPLGQFAARVQELAGGNALAWTLYGPAIAEPHPRHAIQSMLVLRGIDLEMLRRLAAEGANYSRIKLVPPLVTTPEFLKTSCDTFPLELIEVQQKYVVALGEDFFSSLKFEDRNVRLQSERELKVLSIGLRQGACWVSAGKEIGGWVCFATIGRSRPDANSPRSVLWLKGTKDWLPAAAVLEAVGGHLDRPLAGIHHAVAAAEPVDWPAFKKLYADVEAAGDRRQWLVAIARSGVWGCATGGRLQIALVSLAQLGRPARAADLVTIQDPGTYVVDQAHLLRPDTKQSLEGLLAKLQDATTDQVKVLTVPTLGGEDVFPFAQRHYQLWKLGQKNKSNGALIVVAVQERKIRIHTGYGLEGALPDSWCGSLSREAAEKYFRAGNYNDGINFMTVAVVNKVADDANVKIAGAPDIRHVPQNDSIWPLVFVVAVFVLIFVVMYFQRRNGWVSGWGNPGGWYGGSSGGNFGGGWGGSGGGFGGGSFGGGGSSGGGGGGASW